MSAVKPSFFREYPGPLLEAGLPTMIGGETSIVVFDEGSLGHRIAFVVAVYHFRQHMK